MKAIQNGLKARITILFFGAVCALSCHNGQEAPIDGPSTPKTSPNPITNDIGGNQSTPPPPKYYWFRPIGGGNQCPPRDSGLGLCNINCVRS